jgi:signal transduction histidine kinase
VVFGVIGLLSVIGAATLISTIARTPAGGAHPVMAIAGVLAVGVAAFAVLFAGAMRRVALPVGDVIAAAERAGEGDLSARAREAGPPFVRRVARAFNAMIARLETDDARRRDMLADVAHELRTPLSVMQGRLEGIVDGLYAADATAIQELLDDTRLLARLVEDLRALADAEDGALALRREPTDLIALVEDTIGSFRAGAAARGVRLSTAAADDLPMAAIDPIRIREVLINVVTNALQHTPDGGQVSIALSCSREGDRDVARLVVRDTGPGIAADELPRIFDRFSRGAGSRGSGLGLAIARAFVEAHGGTIAAASAPGEGTTMTITLPVES